MIDPSLVQLFRREVEAELRGNILPFWLTHAPDERNGGFRGAIRDDLTVEEDAPRGVILNARIVWTFARAFRFYRETPLLTFVRRGFDYFTRCFFDPVSGGVYWSVDRRGAPLDAKKRTYAQAFALYALAEYHGATGDQEALRLADALLETVVSRCRDARHGGYFETFERDWLLAADQRLSDVDMDEKKSMNTHLHMLEACSAFTAVQPDGPARPFLRELLEILLERIIDPATRHFRMFFDEEWTPRSERVSFGHDIEGSWLLCEAAETLGDPGLRKRVAHASLAMADAVRSEGIDDDGGLLYETGPAGILDGDKYWWPQAEAVVGFLNAFELSGNPAWFDAAWRSWRFITENLVDRIQGEWFSKVSRDRIADRSRHKVDEWKCPYHNTRACIEAMTRLDRLARAQQRKT